MEELDDSGGKRIADRELGRLVDRVERGESAGVIVWKLSRFSRNLLDAVETVSRITAAGGPLIAGVVDLSQPMAKPMLGFLAGFAEEELEGRRENGEQAQTEADGSGGGTPPP